MTTTIIETAKAAKTSEHVGAVGDRVRVEGVIRTMFGAKPTLHVIEDIDGNKFVVSRNSALGSRPGVLVTLEASVKEHRLYKGIKQTVLSNSMQEVVTEDHAFRKAK